MKCQIKIKSNKTIDCQGRARAWLRNLVNAGALFVHSYQEGENNVIKVEEIMYYDTVLEAREALKKFVDIGLLYLEVTKRE